MKGCYKAAVDRTPPPAWVTLERIATERVEMYCQVQFLGDIIPLSVETLQVEESVSKEDDIGWAVRRLRNNCSGDFAGMMVEHIKGCLEEARKAEGVGGDSGRGGDRDELGTRGGMDISIKLDRDRGDDNGSREGYRYGGDNKYGDNVTEK